MSTETTQRKARQTRSMVFSDDVDLGQHKIRERKYKQNNKLMPLYMRRSEEAKNRMAAIRRKLQLNRIERKLDRLLRRK